MSTAETTATLPRRLTLAEYDEMTKDGRLSPDDRVELLDGLLVKKMTRNYRHVSVTLRLFMTLIGRLPAGWHCGKEDPVVLPHGPEQNAPSRPEPDISVRRGPLGTFDTGDPQAADVVLVVEVASEARMLTRDRAGLARYAYNNVPCVWIVNLAAGVVEVYTNPTGPGEDPVYESNTVKSPGESIAVVLDDGVEVRLDVAEMIA